MFLQFNIIDVETRRNNRTEGGECRLTVSHFLTGWEGIGLYALTFKTMTPNNFCSVISPLKLNTGSIPFPIVMLVLRVRYLRFRFNTCAAEVESKTQAGCRIVSNNGSSSGLAPAQNIFAVQVWFGFTQVKYYRFRFGSGSLT